MASSTLLTSLLCLSLIVIAESRGKEVSIECNKNDMTVYLQRDFLSDFYLEDLRLRDTSCTFKRDQNRTHFVLVVPLMSCGTRSQHANDSLVYANVVRQRPLDNNVFINRMPAIEIPLRCAYSKQISATYVDLETKQKRLNLKIKDGSGEFTLQMNLYKDASYTDAIRSQSYPLSVSINQRLYFQLLVDSPDRSLSIVADTCYATPTRIPTQEKRYDIIKDRCPRDATFQAHPSPAGAQRFSFQSFQFVSSKGPPFVFVHCEVRLCDTANRNSRCAKGCEDPSLVQRRIRRSSEDDTYSLEQGPIVLVLVERPGPPQSQEQEGYPISMPWVLVAMGLVCLLCVLVVGYTRRELLNAKNDLSPAYKSTPPADPNRTTRL